MDKALDTGTGRIQGEPHTLFARNEEARRLGVLRSLLPQILKSLSDICNPRERSDDTPTACACAAANGILQEANEIAPLTLDPTFVEASDGDLLIHWDTTARGVVLICSRDGSGPKIYKETLDGVMPIGSELLHNVSAKLLSDALAWLQSPNH